MKAMILAAGEGRRLRPLTEDVPKPMLPVGGRPLLAHLIGLLRAHGVRDIAVNLHHRPSTVRAYLGDGRRLGVRLTYSPEERLLGSAGGVKRMQSFFGDSAFFVLYGDVLTNLNLTALRTFHAERRSALTVALYRPEALNECGVVRLGVGDRILHFVEKPEPGQEPSRLANAGIYLVEPAVLGAIPEDRPFDFGTDLFPLLLEQGVPVFGFVSDALVLDIGTYDRYRQAQAAARRLAAVGAG
jgi:NDP-sugar pyrophosphorylase family protein